MKTIIDVDLKAHGLTEVYLSPKFRPLCAQYRDHKIVLYGYADLKVKAVKTRYMAILSGGSISHPKPKYITSVQISDSFLMIHIFKYPIPKDSPYDNS